MRPLPTQARRLQRPLFSPAVVGLGALLVAGLVLGRRAPTPSAPSTQQRRDEDAIVAALRRFYDARKSLDDMEDRELTDEEVARVELVHELGAKAHQLLDEYMERYDEPDDAEAWMRDIARRAGVPDGEDFGDIFFFGHHASFETEM